MLKQRLDQRQVQKLILAPALQQAIKLLPLTNLELIEVIDEELSENPMLEIEEEETEAAPVEQAAEEPSRKRESRTRRRRNPARRNAPDERSEPASPPKSPDEVEKVEFES